MHGHDWDVAVTVAGSPNPDTVELVTQMPMVLSTIVWELEGKNLNEMVRGTKPTLEGVAAYILERLRLDSPGLVSVTVSIPFHQVTVEV